MIRLFPLVLTAALILGIQPLQAAAIKKLVLRASEAQTSEAWTKFLAAGTQTWSTTQAPAFTPAIRSAIWQVLKTDTEAQAIANPMIEYLEWRRSLDPTRFTSFHPNLSPALAQLLSSPSLPTNPPSPTSTPASEPTTAPQVLSSPVTPSVAPDTTAPQVLSSPATPSVAPEVLPPTIPEPSSLLLAAAMTGWGIWWQRRIAQRTAR